MEKSKEAEPVCSQEALALLNCVAESSYDQDKCLLLLNSLRSCILQKKVKKFSLAEQSKGESTSTTKGP
ncbi:hypothetical protein DCAR_0831765 [Daucus carota subsp. sativus]|uniref:CHCH domain-containing protein n=1 Tax=Daucus carota subsp. sativus TaxID=79200 RepID=A0A175YMM5_DAUCS|nr:hypothetical protein DCAR_0831765 [Daucus carota subsp. sativus]